MQSSATARTTTNNARTAVTYIDSLITTASQEGREFIMVEPLYMNDDVMATIESNGFKVTTIQDSLGTHKRYKISW